MISLIKNCYYADNSCGELVSLRSNIHDILDVIIVWNGFMYETYFKKL